MTQEEEIIKGLESVKKECGKHLDESYAWICEPIDRAINVLEQQSNEDCVIINTNGLDEGIRCAICTNHMKNNRGCDGVCVVDNSMYERVMEVIEKHIQTK